MKTKPKLRASIFREAARLVAQDEEDYACNSIATACGLYGSTDDWSKNRDRLPEVRFFVKTLKPNTNHTVWYCHGPNLGFCSTQFARSLGLLLCAELVKDGWTL